MIARTERNNKIVDLYNDKDLGHTYESIGEIYGLHKVTVREIYLREMAKRGDRTALSEKTIQTKYPYMVTRINAENKSKELSTDTNK